MCVLLSAIVYEVYFMPTFGHMYAVEKENEMNITFTLNTRRFSYWSQQKPTAHRHTHTRTEYTRFLSLSLWRIHTTGSHHWIDVSICVYATLSDGDERVVQRETTEETNEHADRRMKYRLISEKREKAITHREDEGKKRVKWKWRRGNGLVNIFLNVFQQHSCQIAPLNDFTFECMKFSQFNYIFQINFKFNLRIGKQMNSF